MANDFIIFQIVPQARCGPQWQMCPSQRSPQCMDSFSSMMTFDMADDGVVNGSLLGGMRSFGNMLDFNRVMNLFANIFQAPQQQFSFPFERTAPPWDLNNRLPNRSLDRLPDRFPNRIPRDNRGSNKMDEQAVRPMVNGAARETGVDPALIMAVMKQESGFNPKALSSEGAQGLMQIMPETAEDLAKEMGTTTEKVLNDPETNVRAGARYLRKMLDRFNGDTRLALAAYNAGPEAVKKYGGIPPYAETRDFISKVLDYYAEYRNNSPGYQDGFSV